MDAMLRLLSERSLQSLGEEAESASVCFRGVVVVFLDNLLLLLFRAEAEAFFALEELLVLVLFFLLLFCIETSGVSTATEAV